MRLNKSLLFYLAINFLVNFNSMAQNGYIGEDNRREVSELTDTLKTRSQSVVTVVRRHENNHVSGGGYKFNTENANPLDLKICEDQRFANQSRHSEVVCGGVLISGDLILTAASCINEGSDCTSDYSFIFGYTEGQSEFNPRDVYHCQEVIWKKNENGIQAAIIRLDRPVNARIPVPLSIENPIVETQPVITIGPHAKLSLKTSIGQIKYIAQDSNINKTYSVGTDLDCHHDDFGNAVLNQSGQLIGVMTAVTELTELPTATEALVTSLPSAVTTPTEPSTESITESTLNELHANSVEQNPVIIDNKENLNTQSEKTILSHDSSDSENTQTAPFDIATEKSDIATNTDPIKSDPTEMRKTCMTWSSPSNVADRSLYEPVNDPKKANLTYIPRGCTFTPVDAIINDISQYLPQYKSEIRTPTAKDK